MRIESANDGDGGGRKREGTFMATVHFLLLPLMDKQRQGRLVLFPKCESRICIKHIT